LLNGFAEGIALDDRGYVSEGSGENIFTVSNGMVLTPPLSSSILAGITRDSVIQICHELGITVKERSIQRAALYVADELFFSGTAAEITPIRSVDRITVGAGGRGPITEKIQSAFFAITKGESAPPGDWLTYVNANRVSDADSNGSEPVRVIEPPVHSQEAEPVMKFQTAARALD
jgi:branched-chain amino acid aminotransferase